MLLDHIILHYSCYNILRAVYVELNILEYIYNIYLMIYVPNNSLKAGKGYENEFKASNN